MAEGDEGLDVVGKTGQHKFLSSDLSGVNHFLPLSLLNMFYKLQLRCLPLKLQKVSMMCLAR